jgi:hypothetical protein
MMRDGIFSFYVRSGETAFRAIALVENDSIKGFNRSHIYSLERLKCSINRLQKDRNTNWRVKVMEHSPLQGFFMRGFPAKLEGEEGEEQFCLKEGPIQIAVSGSKSKERGCTIFLGIGEANPRTKKSLLRANVRHRSDDPLTGPSRKDVIFSDLGPEDRAWMPIGAAWKPDSLTAPAASKFIDVLAQICGDGNGEPAQFPKDSAKLVGAIIEIAELILHRVAKNSFQRPSLKKIFK